MILQGVACCFSALSLINLRNVPFECYFQRCILCSRVFKVKILLCYLSMVVFSPLQRQHSLIHLFSSCFIFLMTRSKDSFFKKLLLQHTQSYTYIVHVHSHTNPFFSTGLQSTYLCSFQSVFLLRSLLWQLLSRPSGHSNQGQL